MEIITVYRLEHVETRLGPFRSDARDVYDETLPSNEDDDAVHRSCGDGPSPYDMLEDDTELSDFWRKGEGTDAYYFGFISLRSFHSWFDHGPGRVALQGCGIVLAEYVVPRENVLMGYVQLAFERAEAAHIADHPVTITTALPVCI